MIRGAALVDRVTLFAEEEGSAVSTSVFGDPEYASDEEGVEVPAHVEPLDATEDEINRDVRINRYRVTLEVFATLDGLDELAWNGKRYAVQGEPKLYSSYRGAHHYEVEIKGLEG